MMAQMYLYNGVKLPSLPEWDETAYPYAFIYIDGSEYGFWVSDNRHFWKSGLYCAYPNNYPNKYTVYGWTLDNGTWAEDYYFNNSHSINKNKGCTYVWSNTDVFASDSIYGADSGELHLAASAPVPVYGIDRTAFVQGWIVGKRLAGMRGKQADAGTSVLGVAVLGTMILGGE